MEVGSRSPSGGITCTLTLIARMSAIPPKLMNRSHMGAIWRLFLIGSYSITKILGGYQSVPLYKFHYPPPWPRIAETWGATPKLHLHQRSKSAKQCMTLSFRLSCGVTRPQMGGLDCPWYATLNQWWWDQPDICPKAVVGRIANIGFLPHVSLGLEGYWVIGCCCSGCCHEMPWSTLREYYQWLLGAHLHW